MIAFPRRRPGFDFGDSPRRADELADELVRLGQRRGWRAVIVPCSLRGDFRVLKLAGPARFLYRREPTIELAVATAKTWGQA